MLNRWELFGPSLDVVPELDKLLEQYKARLVLADKRWDAIQDAVPSHNGPEADTPRGERLWAICGRAEDRHSEMEWRLAQVQKAYNLLEEIDTSTARTREQNRRRRKEIVATQKAAGVEYAMNLVINLPCFGIVVTKNGKGATIASDLKEGTADPFYDSAMDGIESLILAHACAGINIAAPEYVEGIEAAVQAAANNL